MCVGELFQVLEFVCGNGSARAYVFSSATGGWISTERGSGKHLTQQLGWRYMSSRVQ